MKNTLLFLVILLGTIVYGQSVPLKDTSSTFIYSKKCISMVITPALRDLEESTPYRDSLKIPEIKNNLRRNKYTNLAAFPHGNDPIWQKNGGELPTPPVRANWEGNDNGAFPPDPSGAAGPEHYVQMINSEYIIYDKTGTILAGPNSLASIVGSDAGDPIVMYDRFAKRWMLSAFGVGNQLAVAISTTSDPLGTYYLYTFDMASFPDYPKYGLWHDGYYVTANISAPDCFVFERNKMIAGDPSAAMIALSTPSLGTGAGTETGGFHSVLPAHADFDLPDTEKKMNMFYFQDDAWTGIPDDAIKIWEITTNWDAPASSSVDLIQTLTTTPFDSQFNISWNDIEQPGTAQRLDAIPGAFMYRAQYTEWGSHNTVVLNHTVDVDETDHAGIRWYELREIDGVWSIYQESTYAPDDDSRWLGSISMDYQGNIGLAYAVSGSSTFPSIRYTGRYNADPLNTMTIDEGTAIDGTSVQTGINRYGDYAHMSVDPADDATFWYTGEYLSGGRKTRIFSFKLALAYDNDLGINAVNSPIDGDLSAAETIDVTIKNYGTLPQDDFLVGYQINDGAIISETYSGPPLTEGETATFSFTTLANLSAEGPYEIKAWTELLTDEYNLNDTFTTIRSHLYDHDIGITELISPVSAPGIGLENLELKIKNFGLNTESDFPIKFSIDGAAPIEEIVAGPIEPGAELIYTTTNTADFSILGEYEVITYTDLVEDGNNFNDTLISTVENLNCEPSAGCGFGDGFTNFELGSIVNPSGCSPGGYGDYTDLSTDLARGETHDLVVASDWFNQFVTVWIDFNDNFYFEEDEKIVVGFESDFGATIPFTIPADANFGEHLLRAKSSDNESNTADPCSDMTYGETEDYMVNITEGPLDLLPSVDFSADYLIVPLATTVSFTDLTTGDPTAWSWEIVPGAGWSYTGGTDEISQNPQVIFDETGFYDVQLTATNEYGEGVESKTDYIKVVNNASIVESEKFGFDLIYLEQHIYTFQLKGATEKMVLRVHNSLGQLIQEKELNNSLNSTTFNVDLSAESTGQYLIHISDGKNSKVKKIIRL
jgi:PKD repeat protein